MGRLLVGTDGIRGLAGSYPLDAKTAHAVGAALGNLVAKSGQEQQVVIGMDTRESGSWLAAEVAAGRGREPGAPAFLGCAPHAPAPLPAAAHTRPSRAPLSH